MGQRRIPSDTRHPDETSKILNQFCDYLVDRELSENTIKAYTTSTREFLQIYGQVTKSNGIQWKKKLLEQGKAPKTVNVRLNAYNSLCEMLGRPDAKCKAIKVHQATAIANVISESDYKKLLRKLSEDGNWSWYYNIKLLATTGARISECLLLKKKDFDCGYAELWTKGKFRRIYIPQKFREESLAYYSDYEPDDYLIQNRFGRQMSTRGFATMLQRFSEKYAIDPKCMHPHSFRHLFAIEFLERNKNLSLLADLMGHSSVATTAIYTRMTKEKQREAIDNAVNW